MKNLVETCKKYLIPAENERNQSLAQKKMIETLQENFKSKYKAEIEKAQVAEKEEEDKRKEVIDKLQERIKTVQSKYEETGKDKI